MTPVSAPTLLLPREEWPDADFDLPEGAPLHTLSERDDDDEDWDMEMDLGETGGAKAKVLTASLSTRSELSTSVAQLPGINIRPPLRLPDPDDDDDNEEGISTIKASALPTIKAKATAKPLIESIDEDFEDGFALPTDLTQLSLAPQSLSHRSSKTSLEWGDKDNSSSSQSSDAYSTLGFADPCPSSHSTSSPSLPDTETEEDEDDLDGLVLPSAMFESGQSARQLKKILEMKKKAQPSPEGVSSSKGDPEDDFELGLIINDDVDLSPSRLVSNSQHKLQRPFARSHSIPPQRPSTLRPPSRTKLERSKSPLYPPVSSAKQLQKIRLSPSPPLHPPSRSQQNFSSLVSKLPIPVPSPSPTTNFFSAKPGSLRGQKSHSGLKPPSPPGSARKLSRKASLSSLIESSQAQASGSGLPPDQVKPRYDEPTAASRAKSTHKNSTSRLHDFKVPPTRPSTPSNSAALRLTMPTQSRLRSRPALSQVFAGPSTSGTESSLARSSSPLPPRPSSNNSLRSSAPSRTTTVSPPVAPRLLRRPKRPKTYGDGTELDGIEDLPTDRDKEVRYRVQPKGFGNRIPGASFSKITDKATVRKKGKREGAIASEPISPSVPFGNSLRRATTRIEFPSIAPSSEVLPKKKRTISSPSSSTTKRKPTLIRNLGGTNAPRVVGEMKWNPQSLRWEGNDHVLRDFDVAVGTSTRPALITQLTGSGLGSPAGSFASGARIVGNMIFDPTKMCWVSTLPPEEDEPDVFANLADDEEDSDAWESKGGTIRAIVPQSTDVVKSRRPSNSKCDMSSPSSHTRTISESGSERGSRASMVVCDIDDSFIQSCRDAEERHRTEMKGWKTSLSRRDNSLAADRSYLFEIRALATRKY